MQVDDNIKNLCQKLLDLYKANLSSHSASHTLENTASYKIEANDNWFELSFYLEDYWKYLEEGTKPHFPPVDKIEEWIRVKPIIPSSINGKVPTTKQLAYLISRKISRTGTKPTHILEKTLNSSLVDQITEEVSKLIVNQANKMINDEIS